MKMKRGRATILVIHAALLWAGAFTPVLAADISGAGSTAASPIISEWANVYNAQARTLIRYRPIGSGSGVWLIKNRIVDFAVSDVSLTAQELDADDVVQFPLVIGAVVPIFNLPGIGAGQLKLTGQVLAHIYLGKISNWNDVAIADLNPGLALPDKKIILAHRAEDSGTKYILFDYLAKATHDRRLNADAEAAIGYPYGGDGKGNERVSGFVEATEGAVGYVAYAYVKQRNLAYAVVQNHDGEFVAPGIQSIKSAVANANWYNAFAFYRPLTNLPGKQSWPICGATYVVMSRSQLRQDVAPNVLRFFDWAYHNGGAPAEQLAYAPVPQEVVDAIEAIWTNIKTADGEPQWPGPPK
jgi:phosphate transport system substrate-binding protein